MGVDLIVIVAYSAIYVLCVLGFAAWMMFGVYQFFEFRRHKESHPDATLGLARTFCLGPTGWILLAASWVGRLCGHGTDQQGRRY